MPRFDFQCDECGFEFEMSLAHGLSPKHCPRCAAEPDHIVKLPSAFSTAKLSLNLSNNSSNNLSNNNADEKIMDSQVTFTSADKKKITPEHQCGPTCEIHSKAAALVKKHLK